MSTEEKEALRLVLNALELLKESQEQSRVELGRNISELRTEVSNLRIVIVDHVEDEAERYERFATSLDGHSRRLGQVEAAVRGLVASK